MNQHVVKESKEGTRVDKFVSELLPELSRSFLSNHMFDYVLVENEKVKRSYKLKTGQVVSVDLEGLRAKYDQEMYKVEMMGNIIPQSGALDVCFEDDDYLVLKKSAGVVVHPGIGHESETLSNYVKNYLIESGVYDYKLKRAGIVHRLDMPVAGLIVFAKNAEIQKHLSEQFEKHFVLKIYLADYEIREEKKLFNRYGNIQNIFNLIKQYEEGKELDLEDWVEVSGTMKRDPSNRKRMLFQRSIEDEKLRYAKSYLLPLSDSKMCVLIKTGRMHQIRATFRSLGLIIKGDSLYGWKGVASDEIGLRSVVLGFVDQKNKKRVFNIINAFYG